jgi:hypothetical protein
MEDGCADVDCTKNSVTWDSGTKTMVVPVMEP